MVMYTHTSNAFMYSAFKEKLKYMYVLHIYKYKYKYMYRLKGVQCTMYINL